jgi:hypothetical protein
VPRIVRVDRTRKDWVARDRRAKYATQPLLARVVFADQRGQEPVRRASATPERPYGRRLPIDDCELKMAVLVCVTSTLGERRTRLVRRDDDVLRPQLVQVERVPCELGVCAIEAFAPAHELDEQRDGALYEGVRVRD